MGRCGSRSPSGDANHEPFCCMLQSRPKTATVRRGNGCVAFARECSDTDLLVGQVLLCGIAFERTGAAVLKTVIERF